MQKKPSMPFLSTSSTFFLTIILFYVIDSDAKNNKQTLKDSTYVETPEATAAKALEPGLDTTLIHPKKITAEKLKSYLDKRIKFFLIDGRGSPYFEETIPGAVMIMEEEVEFKKHLLPADKNMKIVAFCAGNGCKASERLCINLMKYGYVNVENLPGGFPDWKGKGFPTIVPIE
jgi:rhodanese-related sulfurtransferase